MKKPPIKTTSQESYVHSAVRMPPELRVSIKIAAEKNGRSMNAEILARLQDNQMEPVLQELADLKQMMRKLLDQLSH